MVIALLGACAGTPATTDIEKTVDACAPLALVSAAPTDVQNAGMDGAQQLWLDRGAPALGLRAGATMEVRFEDAGQPFHGLYDDQEGVIYINRAIMDDAVLSIVIAHELGHAFGLAHVSGRASLMNPGNTSVGPTAEDRAAVTALWGSCAAPLPSSRLP